MTYEFLDYTLRVASSGMFYVVKRSDQSFAEELDMNDRSVLMDCTDKAFTIGAGEDNDMGIVLETTPLQGNQVNLTQSAMLCKVPSVCINAKNKSLKIVLDQGILKLGYPPAEES
jgi:hypothetical protein